jgi:hypothetical protein
MVEQDKIQTKLDLYQKGGTNNGESLLDKGEINRILPPEVCEGFHESYLFMSTFPEKYKPVWLEQFLLNAESLQLCCDGKSREQYIRFNHVTNPGIPSSSIPAGEKKPWYKRLF